MRGQRVSTRIPTPPRRATGEMATTTDTRRPVRACNVARPLCAATLLVAALCAAPLTALAAGGDYARPYALFEPQRQLRAADTHPAFVVKIDGRDMSIDRSEPVAPGMRTVVVSIPGSKGMSNPGRATLEVDAKPCTRYYLAARRSSRTARDWSAFVAASEPIGECVRRFPPS